MGQGTCSRRVDGTCFARKCSKISIIGPLGRCHRCCVHIPVPPSCGRPRRPNRLCGHDGFLRSPKDGEIHVQSPRPDPHWEQPCARECHFCCVSQTEAHNARAVVPSALDQLEGKYFSHGLRTRSNRSGQPGAAASHRRRRDRGDRLSQSLHNKGSWGRKDTRGGHRVKHYDAVR